jgi:hypothetical protein
LLKDFSIDAAWPNGCCGKGELEMKNILQLLAGVILFLAQSDAVIIVELPSADLNRTHSAVASARFADDRLEPSSVNLSEIRALLLGAAPAQQHQMPRISPISVPAPKRGPVK